MTTDPYHLRDYASLDVQEEDGSTNLPVAGISDVSIVPSVTIDHLDTADSIKANTRKQHTFRCEVNIGYALFDSSAALVQQWLAGSGGGTASSMTDTSDPQTFQVSGSFDKVGGGTTLNATVTGITFEEMPVFDGSQDEFTTWDLTGTGEDITGVTMV